MTDVIVDPFAEMVVPGVHGAHVLSRSICRLADVLRTILPLRTQIAITDDASTDGTDAVTARRSESFRGYPLLCLEKSRGRRFRAEIHSAAACS